MNRLSISKRTQILSCLVEGCSIRSTSRLTGASKAAILRLLSRVGPMCDKYHDRVMRNLSCKRLQLDEVWSFIRMKEKRVPFDYKGELGYGDTWIWIALDPDTKLIPSYWIARRDAEDANAFANDLAWRLSERPQITTDGVITPFDVWVRSRAYAAIILFCAGGMPPMPMFGRSLL